MSKRVQLVPSGEKNDGKPIIVEALANDTVKISLGFLKCNHKYRIEVKIPRSITNLSTLESMSDRTNGPNCRLESLTEDPVGLLMEIELLTRRSHKIEEELVFHGEDSLMRFLINAVTLGPDKGTPMLRDGVHLVCNLLRDDGSSEEEEEEVPE